MCLHNLFYTTNFSLHGHLPVYYNDNRYSFNLHYILEEGKKYNFNKTRKAKIKKISQQIREKHNDIANISFSRTLVEYHKVIIEIFEHFFTINTPNFSKEYDNFRKIIDKYKDKEQDDSVCMLLEDSLHIVNTSDEMIESFNNEHSNANRFLKGHIKNFRDILQD